MDFKDIKTNENTIQMKIGNNTQVTIDGEVSGDIGVGGNMNLIVAIISYILCGCYFKELWKRNRNMVNIIAAILWMICGIIFTINFLADIF